MLPRHLRRSAGLLIITLSMLLTLVVAAPVAAKNPPGNNGTVKIDRVAFDDHPNNEPHVGCMFQVDFYGFDADPDPANKTYFAQVIFELHSPTAAGRTMTVTTGNLNPFIGEDDNSGGGSGGQPGLDAAETYTLKFTGDPHPQQGYHVKLTVHAPGSQGADTKHKVFWVTACDPPLFPLSPPPPPPPPTTPNPPGGTGGTESGIRVPAGGTLASSGGPTVVMLPDTAMSTASASLALLAGMALLGGSTALVVVTVRRNRSRRR